MSQPERRNLTGTEVLQLLFIPAYTSVAHLDFTKLQQRDCRLLKHGELL